MFVGFSFFFEKDLFFLDDSHASWCCRNLPSHFGESNEFCGSSAYILCDFGAASGHKTHSHCATLGQPLRYQQHETLENNSCNTPPHPHLFTQKNGS